MGRGNTLPPTRRLGARTEHGDQDRERLVAGKSDAPEEVVKDHHQGSRQLAQGAER